MKHFLFFGVVFFLGLTACNPAPSNPIALIKEVNFNGDSIHYQMDTLKNVKMGFYKRYYKNGNLALEQQYDNDTLIKKERFYFKNGKLREENSYNKGLFDGPTITYYPSGRKKAEGTYLNNAIHGSYKTYYENGNLESIAMMKNNVENGPFEEYAENGNLLYKGTFKNEMEYCLLEVYDEQGSGKLVARRLCQPYAPDRVGRCCTIWTAENGPVPPKNSLCKTIIKEMLQACNYKLEELVQ